jgi:hypothetical protein
MKKVKFVTAGLLIIFLCSLPVVADAHGSGGGSFLGFGAGLITGYLLAPRPAYVAPPVYVPPAQVAQQGSPDHAPVPPPGQTPPPEMYPPPPAPPPSGYSGAAPAPAPGDQAKCREWKMIDRHLEDRWDSYSGKWRQVPVEKWDWVEVPCSNEGPPAGVQGGGNIAPPQAYAFPAPPELAVIPGTYVYFVPGISVDILFYHGYWYRPYGGHWYWARFYNGPWVYLASARVPRVLFELPLGYRRLPPGYHRIPYGHLQANWQRWERERYWHGDREWREGQDWRRRH